MPISRGIVVGDDDKLGAAQLLAVLTPPFWLLIFRRIGCAVGVSRRRNADRPQAVGVLLALDAGDVGARRNRLHYLGQAIQDFGVDELVAVPVLSAFDPSALGIEPLCPEKLFAVLVVAADFTKRGRTVGG